MHQMGIYEKLHQRLCSQVIRSGDCCYTGKVVHSNGAMMMEDMLINSLKLRLGWGGCKQQQTLAQQKQ